MLSTAPTYHHWSPLAAHSQPETAPGQSDSCKVTNSKRRRSWLCITVRVYLSGLLIYVAHEDPFLFLVIVVAYQAVH
ncbi:hypothetical protein DL89DRAFT_265776 [Linderina pennispora]|uniref:Uncharacterized protein n=1 Tax=Linderina pennispora TaxID=61395 RepID=A0A1Y1WF21_9FUNG|nr:uncharacterized protein DL89DRAFT_265776 [Linderina pennispora]ORX72141.1 hypothetical protein DL89DRAFT_265776 [Linderina pennispora]